METLTNPANVETNADEGTTKLLWSRVVDVTGKPTDGAKPDPLIFIESQRGAAYAVYGGEFRAISDGFMIAPEFDNLYKSDLEGRRKALVELAINHAERSAFCIVGLYAPEERILPVREVRCSVDFQVALQMRRDADASGKEAFL